MFFSYYAFILVFLYYFLYQNFERFVKKKIKNIRKHISNIRFKHHLNVMDLKSI